LDLITAKNARKAGGPDNGGAPLPLSSQDEHGSSWVDGRTRIGTGPVNRWAVRTNKQGGGTRNFRVEERAWTNRILAIGKSVRFRSVVKKGQKKFGKSGVFGAPRKVCKTENH